MQIFKYQQIRNSTIWYKFLMLFISAADGLFLVTRPKIGLQVNE